jgi:hypothetical protein
VADRERSARNNMTLTEALLLAAFVTLCLIPGVISGSLLRKKTRGFELKVLFLHLLAVAAPLLFFFVGSMFDRPESRRLFSTANIQSAFGMMCLYGGPSGAIIGVVSLIVACVSYALLKPASGRSEK